MRHTLNYKSDLLWTQMRPLQIFSDYVWIKMKKLFASVQGNEYLFSESKLAEKFNESSWNRVLRNSSIQ